MRPDEAWFFKQYDTRDGVAKQCYHNSFVDPKWLQDKSKPGRKSVEFRILLVISHCEIVLLAVSVFSARFLFFCFATNPA